MTSLVRTFLEIAVWRKGPQDLPASGSLALLVLATYVGVDLLSVQLFELDLRIAAVLIGVNILMLGAWLWLVLVFFERRQRFVQTMTATLGVGVLIVLLDILVRLMHSALGVGDVAGDWSFARLIIVALVMGRILMHALDRDLITGMGLTIAIVYSTGAVGRLTLESLG